MKRLVLCLVPLLLLAGCWKDRCDTPFGTVGTIDVTLPDYANLHANPGATLVLANAGHRGVLVHCLALNDYAAFECACPHDHDVRLLPNDDRQAVSLRCPVCGSQFELVFGNPLDGAVTGCPLYQYNTTFDGRLLTIY